MSSPQQHRGQVVSSLSVLACGLLWLLPQPAHARVSVPIVNQTAGQTPFIENVTVDITAGGTLNTVYYIVYPQPGARVVPSLGLTRGVTSLRKDFRVVQLSIFRCLSCMRAVITRLTSCSTSQRLKDLIMPISGITSPLPLMPILATV